MVLAGGDHVGLEQTSLEDDVVVDQSLEQSGVGSGGGGLTSVEVVVSVNEHLGLNDGHDTGNLTDGSISGQGSGLKVDRQLTGEALSNLEDASVLGESAALVVEGSGSDSEFIKTLGVELSFGTHDGTGALIELDSGKDTLVLEDGHEGSAIGCLLFDSLLEEDDS